MYSIKFVSMVDGTYAVIHLVSKKVLMINDPPLLPLTHMFPLPDRPRYRPPCTPGECSSCCTSSSRRLAPPALYHHWPVNKLSIVINFSDRDGVLTSPASQAMGSPKNWLKYKYAWDDDVLLAFVKFARQQFPLYFWRPECSLVISLRIGSDRLGLGNGAGPVRRAGSYNIKFKLWN